MRNYAYFRKKRSLGPTQNLKRTYTIMATKDIDLEFRSNSRFGYCNTNYAMLALVIEK
jgi:CubicO group peptidase (beta-lactamase class C family)